MPATAMHAPSAYPAALASLAWRLLLNNLFKVIQLEVPGTLAVEALPLAQLPADCQPTSAYARCQPLGADWYRRQAALVLRVPSSIIAHKHSYVLNTRHPNFAQMRIVGYEDFAFDPRLKALVPGVGTGKRRALLEAR